MAYTTNTFSELTYSIGGRNRWWTYESADTLATILGAGYVSDAGDKKLQVGDIVFARFGTLNTTGPDQSPSTKARGTVSEFAAAPGYEALMVDTITAGAATLKTARTETITDNSGGTANAATGVVANLAKQTVVLPLQLADIATGDFKVAMPFAGSISSVLFRTAKPASTAAKLATLTASVAGTPATGGAMALTTANQNAIGGSVAGSAITAGGAFTAGQTIGVTASAVTAFVEGDGYVEFTVVNTDLANAIATLIKF